MTPSSLSDEHDSTEFFEVNSSESEDGVMKDVKERLTCRRLGTLSTLGWGAGRPRRKEERWGKGPSLAITTMFCSEFA